MHQDGNYLNEELDEAKCMHRTSRDIEMGKNIQSISRLLRERSHPELRKMEASDYQVGAYFEALEKAVLVAAIDWIFPSRFPS